jgi:hypothetical protein
VLSADSSTGIEQRRLRAGGLAADALEEIKREDGENSARWQGDDSPQANVACHAQVQRADS